MKQKPFGMGKKGSISIEAALLTPIIIMISLVFIVIIKVSEVSVNLKHLAIIHADYVACKEESIIDPILINVRAKKQWITDESKIYLLGPHKQGNLLMVSAQCRFNQLFVGDKLLVQRAFSIQWPEYMAPEQSDTNVWKLQPMTRGYTIQERFGRNLPRFYPVICKFNDGNAVSMISADLTLKTYQISNELFSLIYEEVIRVEDFSGSSYQDKTIESSMIKSREVWIVIPEDTLNDRLRNESDKAIKMGKDLGIKVKIVEYQKKEE